MYAWRKFTVKPNLRELVKSQITFRELGKQVRTYFSLTALMQRILLCTVSLRQNHSPHKIFLQDAVCGSLIISVPFSPLLRLPALH